MNFHKSASVFTRHMYSIPGGYFIVQLVKKILFRRPNTPLWETFGFRGIKMRVDLSKQMGAAIYWRGAHDWAPIFALEKTIKPGDTFLDIGANQGEYTLWAARKTGPKGKVYAFEPLRSMYGQLTYNISLNPKYASVVTPIQLGLSDEENQLELYSGNLNNEGVNTLFPDPDSTLLETIQLKKLDDVVKAYSIGKIDGMKIDVEGAEYMVLKGAFETIKKNLPYLFIEVNKEACLKAGYEASAILELLAPLGYKFELIGLRGKMTPVAASQLPAFCNIYAYIPR
jgi:FkbM family methyltransferase